MHLTDLKSSLVLPIFHSADMTYFHSPPPYHERQRRLCCGAHTLNNLFQYKWVDSSAMDALATSLAVADQEEQSNSTGSTDHERGWWPGIVAAASSHSRLYKSLIPGLGSYDVSVLVEALKQKKAKFAMHLLGNQQLEKDLTALSDRLSREGGKERGKDRTVGIILNRMSRNVTLRWLLDGRHWLALVPRSSSSSTAAAGAAAATATIEAGEVAWWDVDSKLPAPMLIGGVPQLLIYLRKNILEEGGQAFVVTEDEKEEEEDEEQREEEEKEEEDGN